MIFSMSKHNGKGCAGTTLVEVIVTMFISTIAIGGLAMAFADGVGIYRKETARIVLYNEADAAMRLIGQHFYCAYYVNTRQAWNEPSSYLYMESPGLNFEGKSRAEFFFYPQDNSMRWNDLSGNVGRFNLMLIPEFDYDEEPDEPPYVTVEALSFTGIDPVRPPNPTTEGFLLIRVDLKLRSDRGDSLVVSKMFGKTNNPNGL